MLEPPKFAGRLSAVQALRFFAASVVVIYHAVEATLRHGGGENKDTVLREIAWLGNFGVDVFFVISGFIMIYAHFSDFGMAGASRRFLTTRFIRILPNYWLLTGLATVTIFFAPQLSQYGREADVWWIAASFFFIPYTSSSGISLPVLGLGWTLNYEMYFYMVFSIALFMPRRKAMFVMTAFFILSIGFGYIVGRNGPLVSQATHWLLLEFLLGVYLGLAFRHGLSIPNSAGVALIVGSCVLLALSVAFKANGSLLPFMRFIFFGLAATCLVAAATLTPRSRVISFPRQILFLGDASYSLYLTHAFTLPACILVFERLSFDVSTPATVLMLFVTSTIVAVTFYRVFEKPSQSFFRSRRTQRSERAIG